MNDSDWFVFLTTEYRVPIVSANADPDGNATITWVDADGLAYDITPVDSSGMFVEDAVIGLGMSPINLYTDERITAGSSLAGTRDLAATIVLPMFVEDMELLELLREAIPGRPTVLRVTKPTRYRDLIDVYYVAGLEGDDSNAGVGWKRFVLELRALNPHWHDPEQVTYLFAPGVNNLYDAALAYDADLPYDGPGVGISAGVGYDTARGYDLAVPYDGGQVLAPAVTSRLGAWPTFELLGPATSFQITHLRTGERIALVAGRVLGDGVTMTVTTDPNGRDVTVNGVPAWDQVTPDSSAAMDLHTGDQLAVLMGGTNASSRVGIKWRQRWRTP